MSDRWVLALAAAAALGAAAARPVPAAVVVVAVVVALGASITRRPLALVLAAAVAASFLGARATEGAAPVRPGAVDGVAVLAGDPEPVGGAVRVVVRLHGHRYEAWAYGTATGGLAGRSAGEHVALSGRVRPAPAGRAEAFARRHLVGRLDVERVTSWAAGPPVVRAATRVRATLADGAAPLGPDRAALFAGLVLGDDRGQDVVLRDDVEAAGLTHLLAVSGANVAFVLALAGPLLRRLPPGGRLGATLAVVAWFAFLTRGEPSVLRAVAMASTRAVAEAAGREAGGLRALGLGVCALLLVDPLLVWSVGFQLSVAASAAIVAWAGPVRRRLPGPSWVAEPLAVVIAAQLGVAPVAVPTFGALPVAAFPANLLVGPVAGVVTMWGLTGGLLAGLVGGSWAGVLHLPTRLALSWFEHVARVVGRLPLGDLGPVHLVVVAGAVVLAGSARRLLRAVAAAAGCAVLLAAALGVQAASVTAAPLAGGATLWQGPWRGGTATVLVAGRLQPDRLLESLRSARVEHLDVVVLPGAAPTQAAALGAVLRRYPATLVWAPAGAPVAGAVTPRVGQGLAVGPFRLVVEAVTPRLVVVVDPPPPGASEPDEGLR